MKILLIGSGGRENAFARQISLSHQCEKLFIAPGNPGTAYFGQNVTISTTDFNALKQFVLENAIQIVIVGPEAPLVEGIFDFFLADNELKSIPVIGPSQQGAMLEGSKAFSKAFMLRHQIPTAAFQEFTEENIEEGLAYISTQSTPIVLKADGLAAGKGVLICNSIKEAQEEFREMLGGKFGDAGNKVVIEEFMSGIEFSVFVLSDGKNYKILPVAKDYKRIGEGDTGLNTGGMGAVSPPPFVTPAIIERVEREVILPTIKGLQKDNIVYKGFIYIGLMNTPGDIPKVVEYNCRMGDPETQAVLPRIETDFMELMQHVADGTLDKAELKISDQAAVTVILASGGYPGDFEKGYEITGIENVKDTLVFHAGTQLKDEKLVNSGGRVIAVTSLDKDWLKALNKSNLAAETIQFYHKYYRRDIGFDLK
ncbi:MAG: phosphoribosylamine--glycine ligase [Chitinophagales bacterium]|nr:phosphoribosylamine--glycine ligase [Chitinophagales bacterium]